MPRSEGMTMSCSRPWHWRSSSGLSCERVKSAPSETMGEDCGSVEGSACTPVICRRSAPVTSHTSVWFARPAACAVNPCVETMQASLAR